MRKFFLFVALHVFIMTIMSSLTQIAYCESIYSHWLPFTACILTSLIISDNVANKLLDKK